MTEETSGIIYHLRPSGHRARHLIPFVRKTYENHSIAYSRVAEAIQIRPGDVSAIEEEYGGRRYNCRRH
jgi:hypothetical protein